MKLLILILLSFSPLASDKCTLVLHENVTKKMTNIMILDIIEYDELSIDNFSEDQDYGVKEVSRTTNSLVFDIFGEPILNKHIYLEIYKAGQVVERTLESTDLRMVSRDFISKLKSLTCIKN